MERLFEGTVYRAVFDNISCSGCAFYGSLKHCLAFQSLGSSCFDLSRHARHRAATYSPCLSVHWTYVPTDELEDTADDS